MARLKNTYKSEEIFSISIESKKKQVLDSGQGVNNYWVCT